MKRLILMVGLLSLTACAMEPLTPEEQARRSAAAQQFSQSMNGFSQQLNQQQRNNTAAAPRICNVMDMGGGMKSVSCP